VESSRCRVDLQRGADNPEHRWPLGFRDKEGDRGESGFLREYPRRCCREAVCGPSRDLSLEGFQACGHCHTRREDVGPSRRIGATSDVARL